MEETTPNVPCPVPMEDPEPDFVRSVFQRRNFSDEIWQKEKDKSFSLILDRVLPEERLSSRDWCKCGHCSNFSTIRENLCCGEICCDPLPSDRVRRAVMAKLNGRLSEVSNACITHHPSFAKIVLDEEVLSVWVEDGRFEVRGHSTSREGDPNKVLRYYAYRSFVLWAYGRSGLGNRLELPSCVRAAIVNKFPSRTEAYVGFQGISNALSLDCDEEHWRDMVE